MHELEKMNTRELLAHYRRHQVARARRASSSRLDSWYYSTEELESAYEFKKLNAYFDRLKEILATREHVPSSLESKVKRRRMASRPERKKMRFTRRAR